MSAHRSAAAGQSLLVHTGQYPRVILERQLDGEDFWQPFDPFVFKRARAQRHDPVDLQALQATEPGLAIGKGRKACTVSTVHDRAVGRHRHVPHIVVQSRAEEPLPEPIVSDAVPSRGHRHTALTVFIETQPERPGSYPASSVKVVELS